MKHQISILLIFFALNCLAQKYADKKYYLIDQLVLEDLSEADKKLISSSLKKFHSEKNDTVKINLINKLVEECLNDEVWPKYNKWVNEFVKKKLTGEHNKLVTKHFKTSLAATISNMGYYYQNNGEMTRALEYYQKAIDIQEKIGDKKGIANSYNNIGYVYSSKGAIPQALENYHQSLKIQEEIGDHEGMAGSYNNIGVIYQNQGDLSLALKYYHKSVRISEKLGDKRSTANSYNNIGAIHDAKGNKTKALKYFTKSLKIREEIGDIYGTALSYNSIGSIYIMQGKMTLALEYCNKSLQLREKINDKLGMAISYNNIGRIKLEAGAFLEAETLFTKGLNLADTVGLPKWISVSAKNLSDLFKRTRRFDQSLKMYELHIQMRDSINNEATQKSAAQQHAKYNYEKQKALDDATHDKLMAVEQEQQEKQKVISYATTCGLLLILGFLIFVVNRLKVTSRQKNEIDLQKSEIENTHKQLSEHHKEIQDSINYAERIQRSFLATKEILDENLSEYFVFFKPKDVVSGDFYWADKLDNGKFAIVNADSTGHGVPGAIMSILNISAIEGAIKDGARKPNEIFNRARTLIIERLKRDGSEQGGQDGMDASIVCLNADKTKMTYTAAQNPIWIIRAGELIALKPEKMPVGKHSNDKVPFEGGTFDLLKGDQVYTLTDGFQDQFGGSKGRKFMVKKLSEYILAIAHLSMTEQHQKMDELFTNWKGSLDQVDDVCIIGFKL